MKLIIGIALLFVLAACQSPTGELKAPAGGAEKLVASDGTSLAYFYLPARDAGAPGVILLHMLGSSKEDYAEFAQRLNNAGYAVIAIDFRGHGKSQGDLRAFKDQDFNNMVKDVKAAKDFLAAQGVSKVGIVGASIGANVALQYASGDHSVKTLVLISPGENYHGVTTEDAMPLYPNPVLLMVSEDDRDSAVQVKKLLKLAHASASKVFPGKGHGTAVFKTTDAEQNILIWLKRYLWLGNTL